MGLPNVINDINDLQNQVNTIKSTYLPLSGGTVTGSIINTHNKGLVATNSSHMDVGYDYNQATGGLIALRSMNYTGNPGGFEIFARSSSATKILNGKTDGTLTWGGNTIDTVVSFGSGYIRYSSGLQICWGRLEETTSISTSWGGGVETVLSNSITFPVAFSSAPSASVQNLNGNGLFVEMMGVSTTAITSIAVWRPTEAGEYISRLSWIAIGRWK